MTQKCCGGDTGDSGEDDVGDDCEDDVGAARKV